MKRPTYKIAKGISIVGFLFFLGCTSSDDGSASGFQNEIERISTFGGSRNESAQSVTATTDGGYIVLGHAQSMDGDIIGKTNESYDFWVLKFDSDSSLQWSRTYGGTGDDRGKEIIETIDGGYAIVGFTDSSDQDVTENAGAKDHWVAKLDGSGTITWQKSFGFSGGDSGYSIIQTNDGGFLISGVLDVSASGGAGNTRSQGQGQRHAGGDYWALKLDGSGNLQWSRYFGGSFTDTPFDVVQSDTGYIIVGSSDSDDVDISDNKGQYDFWVISISGTGALVWERTYGGSEIDEARAIIDANDGNFIIVGDTRSNNQDVTETNGGADVWAVKIDPAGNVLWEKAIGGSSFDVGRSVSRLNDGNFLISGSARSGDGDITNNQGQNDGLILKLSDDGNLVWQKTIGGSSIDFFNDAIQLSSGQIIAVGDSSSSDGDIFENKGFTDLLVVRLK